ncbi:hypothetical protein BTA51_24245 [Hahella sp. CCB-MM4]|uniref:hypothetical protein n=1 Tax=Hahella sp. (strain CCB-MM4) TaxID=1926491 RepID=UPI000BD89EEF|nr:hypothetical protein [Hahella sp. CCB-MM4]OZG70705.1 hypothetical protein BTA51_24245 [Hahella sp. CCB-MM4]
MTSKAYVRLAGSVLAASFLTASFAHGADYSVGGRLGTQGIGASLTQKQDWSLTDGDQLQLRFLVVGLDVNDIDDLELNGRDYKGDISSYSLQGGVDWYPFSGRYTDNFFFSTGLTYFDNDINGTSKDYLSANIGGTSVTSADRVKLNADIEQSSLAPYLSMGWGNRIREEGGLSFQAELGFMAPFSDADVKLTATDPGSRLSAQNLERERQRIEDDLGDIYGFLSVAVTYQF